MNTPATIKVLGVRFQDLTRAEAAQALVALAEDGGRHYVVKPYSEFMPRAVRDGAVRDALLGADLCLPDGVGILWAAHYLSLPGGRLRALLQLAPSLLAMVFRQSVIRHPLRQAMRGPDFTWEVLAACEKAWLSVYLLGGTADEVRGTTEHIAERLPALRVAGAQHGYFADTEAVLAQLNAAAPDVLLVALGFPKQELWIAENLARLQVKVAVAEGGSFSFISGKAGRAPGWMRRAGLEWLYRLMRQPWRLRRQLALPAFVWLVVGERLRRG
jgi:N-acetylglucosaminyldiphosphoundecaprenol N-acetyl-beta-D-mannosaminyltransferase